MNKIKRIAIYLLMLSNIFIFISCKKNCQENIVVDEWNGGYCIEDNGRLDYIGTGHKVHYKCNRCGKEYVFDEVKQYKK